MAQNLVVKFVSVNCTIQNLALKILARSGYHGNRFMEISVKRLVLA